jgi:hypothetical protein
MKNLLWNPFFHQYIRMGMETSVNAHLKEVFFKLNHMMQAKPNLVWIKFLKLPCVKSVSLIDK